MAPDFGVVLLTYFTAVSIILPPFGCPVHCTCQLLDAEAEPDLQLLNCSGSSIAVFKTLFGLVFSPCHWSKKLAIVIQEISILQMPGKTKLECVTLCFTSKWRIISSWSWWRHREVFGDSWHDLIELSPAFLPPAAPSQWRETPAHFWEMPFIVGQELSHRRQQEIIPSQYQNQIITQMQKPNQNKTRVKMMKKQCAVTQCKTYTMESHILLLKCQMLITIKGNKWFQLFVSLPPPKRQTLKWDISKCQTTQKSSIFRSFCNICIFCPLLILSAILF